MSESTGFVQESIDRFQSARDSIERDVRKFRKNLQSQRRDIEKRFERSRKNWERRARRQIDRTLADVRKRPAYKRADSLRRDVSKRVEQGVENVLGTFGIASRGELHRIDRKLNQLNRKLRELERGEQPIA